MYRSLATGMLVLGIPMAAAAECISDPDGVLAARSLRAANFVFDGTVLSVDLVASDGTLTPVDDVAGIYSRLKDAHLREFASTLEVHRVWKGDVPETFTVYFVWNVDGPYFEVGQRRIVFANHQTEATRKTFGTDPRAPRRNAWVWPCSGYSAENKRALKQLGRARKPIRSERIHQTSTEKSCKPVFERTHSHRGVPHFFVDQGLETIPHLYPNHVLLAKRRFSELGEVVFSLLVYKEDAPKPEIKIEGMASHRSQAWYFSALCSAENLTDGLVTTLEEIGKLSKH